MDHLLGLLTMARANEIDFGVAVEQGGFAFNFEDSIVDNVKVFENPGRSVVAYSAVPVHYRDPWREDRMGIVFAQAALDRYVCDSTNLFQVSSSMEQSQTAVFLRANISGSTDLSGGRSGTEEVSEAFVVE